jgi:hypothetical protein
MKIDEVIIKLEEYKKQHGNIEVRVGGYLKHWGMVYNEINENTLKIDEKTQLNIDKFEEIKSVVFISSVNNLK